MMRVLWLGLLWFTAWVCRCVAIVRVCPCFLYMCDVIGGWWELGNYYNSFPPPPCLAMRYDFLLIKKKNNRQIYLKTAGVHQSFILHQSGTTPDLIPPLSKHSIILITRYLVYFKLLHYSAMLLPTMLPFFIAKSKKNANFQFFCKATIRRKKLLKVKIFLSVDGMIFSDFKHHTQCLELLNRGHNVLVLKL